MELVPRENNFIFLIAALWTAKIYYKTMYIMFSFKFLLESYSSHDLCYHIKMSLEKVEEHGLGQIMWNSVECG